MEGNSGNKEDVFFDAEGISLEKCQQLMTYLMPEIQRAQQQDVNAIREVINQTLENDFSFIEEKFQNIDLCLQQLRSGKITQDEMKEASDEVFSIIGNEDTQKRIAKSVDQELVDKSKNLSLIKNAFAKSSKIGNTVAALPIILVALPLVLLYTGLKRAMPSKAEFKKTWQGISHDFKNAIDKVPTVQEKDSSIKKLFYDLGVKEEHKNLIKEYIVKNDGSKDQLKVDDNKIEAFKKAVLIEKPNIDNKKISSEIDRLVEKGKSTSDGDYGKFKAQIENVISIIGQDVLKNQEMKEMFKGELNEIEKTKATEKAAKQETSFLDKIKDRLSPNRNSSHAESVETGRRESNSSQGRST